MLEAGCTSTCELGWRCLSVICSAGAAGWGATALLKPFRRAAAASAGPTISLSAVDGKANQMAVPARPSNAAAPHRSHDQVRSRGYLAPD